MLTSWGQSIMTFHSPKCDLWKLPHSNTHAQSKNLEILLEDSFWPVVVCGTLLSVIFYVWDAFLSSLLSQHDQMLLKPYQYQRLHWHECQLEILSYELIAQLNLRSAVGSLAHRLPTLLWDRARANMLILLEYFRPPNIWRRWFVTHYPCIMVSFSSSSSPPSEWIWDSQNIWRVLGPWRLSAKHISQCRD